MLCRERKFGGYVVPGNVSDAANQIDELRSFSDGKFVNLAAALVKTVLYQNGAPISSMHRGLWNDKVQGGDITGTWHAHETQVSCRFGCSQDIH